MPIKNSFRRSLLNCQPQSKVSSRVVSTSNDKEDGYAGVPAGFSNIIERQVGLEFRSEDSISLVGIFDSAGSEKFSTDPQRPEIISITQLFNEDPNIYRQLLRLKNLEASLDEADLKTLFDVIFSRPSLRQALEERLDGYFENRSEVNEIFSSLAQIVESIDSFRDSINFIESNKVLHRISSKKREKIISKFSEDPKGFSMSLKRTFLGLDDVTSLSNTSLIQLLVISLLLPGNVSFKPPETTSGQGNRFFLPFVAHDVTSDFLQLLSKKDVRNKSDFFDIEASLPKDAYARLCILTDALSYELTTTVGLKKAGTTNVFDVLNSKVSPVLNVIREEPKESAISSLFRNDTTLPFEVRNHTIDGVSYKSVLERYIDPSISNASLDFSELNSFSRDFSSKLGSYLNQVKTIRAIGEGEPRLTGSGLLTWACGYVVKGTDRYRELLKAGQTVTAPNELVQLSLFCEIAKNNTELGIGSRFDIFTKIFDESKQNSSSSTTSPERLSILKPFKTKTVTSKSTLAKNISDNNYSQEQKGPYAKGGFYDSKLGKTSDEKNKGTLESVDIDELKVGVSKASLELLDISIDDIMKSRNNVNQIETVQNPVVNVAASKTNTRTNKTVERKTKKEFTRSKAISHITLGSYAIDVKIPKKNQTVKIQNPINSNRSFLKNISSNVRKSSRKVENNDAKSSKITSTFITPETKRIKIDLLSSKILGTSLIKDGVIEHSNISYGGLSSNLHVVSSNKFSSNNPSMSNDVESTQELSNLISAVRLIDEASRENNQNSDLKLLNLNLASFNVKEGTRNIAIRDGADIPEKYFNIFNTLTDGTKDVVSGAVTSSTLEEIIDRLNVDKSISYHMKAFYVELMKVINDMLRTSGDSNTITSNYFLNDQKIKFLIYQIFNSILSLFDSVRLVKISEMNSQSTKVLTVQSRINVNDLLAERRALDAIATTEGTVAEIISTTQITPSFSNILKAISYCSTSNDLIIERYSVLKAFVEMYTTSVASLTNAVSSNETKKIVNSLKTAGKLEILNNLTLEYISSKQLSLIKDFEDPITVRYSTRTSRIANNIISLLLGAPNVKDFDVITIGIPVKGVEVLRRVDSNSIVDLDKSGRGEYVEIELSKRDIQFSDIVRKPVKIRFTPFLEVIPQFTTSLDMITSFEDFTFLCYFDKRWNQLHLSDAVNFVSNKTGLEYADSVVVVINHIVDALCKLSMKSLSSIMIEDLTSTRVKNEISKGGYDFFKNILKDQVSGRMLPTGDMNDGEYLYRNEASNYSLKMFSELGKNVIDKTDQPTHRLLSSFLNDPIFYYENEFSAASSTPPFERVYCCAVSTNDFEIDRTLSYSIESAKAMISGLIRSGLMVDDGASLKYVKENGKVARLIADEISAKINLVSN